MRGIETIDLEPIYSYGSGPRVLVVPGWIGRGRDRKGSPSQYRPLFSGALAKFNSIWAVDFKLTDAPRDIVVQDLSRVIEASSKRTPKLSILASSYGAKMIIRALAQANVDSDTVNTVLVDPPAGAASLVKLNQFRAAWLGKKIGVLPSWLNQGASQAMFDKLFCPGLSDSDPIEVPAAVQAKGQAEVERFIRSAQQDAFDGQQGFPLTLCAAQIGEMAKAVDDPSYLRACDAVNRRYSTAVTRVICTRNNQVVDPAVADPFYHRHMPSVKRVEADSNHCDYLQRRDFWNELLTPLV